jgi:hypothetical protein
LLLKICYYADEGVQIGTEQAALFALMKGRPGLESYARESARVKKIARRLTA